MRMVEGDEYPAELGGPLAQRRRAQARRVFHHRARPLSHRGGEVDAVLRRLDEVPWWSRVAGARAVPARAPRACHAPGRSASRRRCCLPDAASLVRGWIDGVPLHIAKPHGDAGYFRSAKAALRTLHRAGISPQRSRQGAELALRAAAAPISPISSSPPASAAAACCSASRATRICGICSSTSAATRPSALTAAERRVLARKSFITRAWMATGKKVYYAITRGLEFHRPRGPRPALCPRGAGDRRAAAHASAGPRRRRSCRFPTAAPAPASMPLSKAAPSDRELLDFLGAHRPEHLQVVDALPRDAQGEVRSEILELVAMNQLDLIEPLIKTDAERAHRRPHRLRSGAICATASRSESQLLTPAIRAGLRAARQISHCRRHGEISAGAKGSQRSKRSSDGRTSATGRNAGNASSRQRRYAPRAPRQDGGARRLAIRRAPR